MRESLPNPGSIHNTTIGVKLLLIYTLYICLITELHKKALIYYYIVVFIDFLAKSPGRQ